MALCLVPALRRLRRNDSAMKQTSALSCRVWHGLSLSCKLERGVWSRIGGLSVATVSEGGVSEPQLRTLVGSQSIQLPSRSLQKAENSPGKRWV